MHIFTKIFLLVLSVQISYVISVHKKCCDKDNFLRRNFTNYFCDSDKDKRLQIFTSETNAFSSLKDGICFDTYPNITEYKIRNHSVVEEKQINVNFYLKCCPLGYFYHSAAHSCIPKDQLDKSFITQNFIKVGLPHCNLIVDYKLIPGKYRMELGNLYIEETRKFQEGRFCVDKDENNFLIARGCYDDLGPCYEGIKCIHKCCPDGQSFVNGQKCVNTYEHGLNLSFTDRVNNSQDSFAIIHNYDCRIYILKTKIRFYVDTDGTFYAFSNKTNSFLRFGIEDKSYCIEHIKKGSRNNFEFLMCFEDIPIAGKFIASRWAKIFSCIFIILTITVYLMLPEMMNLFGKVLVSYCSTILGVFIILTYAQFDVNISDNNCVIVSFLASFLSIASFAWMNVMCFDIWWTFGTPKSFKFAAQKKNELKRFLFYNLHGWGLPVLLTFLTYLFYKVFNTPYSVRPFLGSFKCFWEKRDGNYGMFIFYVTPLILMETVNFILFMRTILYCLKVKDEVNRMNDNISSSMREKRRSFIVDKEQLILILKLSVIMGISFMFEVLSSLFSFNANKYTEYVEIVWDTYNCLQGVFIFFIFVCKSKVFHLIMNKFNKSNKRKISVSATTASTNLTESVKLNTS